MTKQDKLDALKEQVEYHKNRLKELNPGRHGEEALTCFSLGWDHCLLFLSKYHGLDLTKL
jgi:hypothetical protein